MFFEDFDENFNTLIAKSADLTNKPFMHSVVKICGEYKKGVLSKYARIVSTSSLGAVTDLEE